MMKLRSWSVLLLSLLISGVALAQSDKKTSPAPAPSAQEKAMMDAWMKAMTPGDAHRKLDALVGTFDVKVKNWMQPGAPVMESSGVSENKWVLGGRWIEQHFDGQFMGQPYSGLGHTGYDNIKKQYVSTWMDSMSTGVMTTMGTADAGGIALSGSVDDPMTGKAMDVKEKFTLVDNDHQTFEMWSPGPDGKMFKTMELTYSRKK